MTLLVYCQNIPEQLLEMESLNILYLNLVEAWFITIAEVLMTAALHDHKLHFKNEWLANHDDLTGLKNRIVFEKKINNVFSSHRREDRSRKLLFIGLDQMKHVNDEAGHLAGDKLLIMVSEALQKAVRDSDFVARWGGDEFSILLEDCSHDEAEHISHKTLNALREIDFPINELGFVITASIGITDIYKGDSLGTLIERADEAVYKVKNSGKNGIHYTHNIA